MLQLEPFTEDQGRPAVITRSSASLRLSGFSTRRLARMSDSLVRVSRRAAYNHYASILDLRRSPQSQLAVFPQAIILTEASYIPMDLSCHQN